MKLKALAAGLSLGVFWGLTLFIFTVISLYTGYLGDQLNFFVGIYPFYEISWLGALAGLIDGLLDGFVVGWILALLYNGFACCCKKCEK